MKKISTLLSLSVLMLHMVLCIEVKEISGNCQSIARSSCIKAIQALASDQTAFTCVSLGKGKSGSQINSGTCTLSAMPSRVTPTTTNDGDGGAVIKPGAPAAQFYEKETQIHSSNLQDQGSTNCDKGVVKTWCDNFAYNSPGGSTCGWNSKATCNIKT